MDSQVIDLSALIPKLGPTSGENLAKRYEIQNLIGTDPGVFPHQERARRACLGATAGLFMHQAGLGKTLAMILSVENYRNSIGLNSQVHIITKKTISGFTKDDIKEKLNLRHREISDYYTFHTYSTFNDLYGSVTEEKLIKIFKGSIIVIDEFHSVYSYIQPQMFKPGNEDHENIVNKWLNNCVPGWSSRFESEIPIPKVYCNCVERSSLTRVSETVLIDKNFDFAKNTGVYFYDFQCGDEILSFRSLYETLVIIRNLLPDIFILALTATPMMNSASEIEYLARVLITAKNLPNGVKNDRMDKMISCSYDEIDDLEIFEDERNMNPMDYAKALVNHVPILYKQADVKYKPTYKGSKIQIGTNEYTKLSYYMESEQSENYVNNFTQNEFYRLARENSLCYAGPLRNIPDDVTDLLSYVGKFSKTFQLWLTVDAEALFNHEGGVTAWYLDDIVQNGAMILCDLYVKMGWAKWPAREPGRTVLLLTGEDRITDDIRRELNSSVNVDGSVIRTIIYTKAIRDGVSFPNVLRGGSVSGFSGSGHIQADARKLRINSFDKMLLRIKNDPDFKRLNEKYITNTGSISPHVYDVICYPLTVPQQLPPRFNEWGSIDLHVLALRTEKSEEITPVYKYLTENSVDILAEQQKNVDFKNDNFLSSYFWPCFRKSVEEYGLQLYSKNPHPYFYGDLLNHLSPVFLNSQVGKLFRQSYGMETEALFNMSKTCIWKTGTAGLGPAPICKDVLHAKSTMDPNGLDFFSYLYVKGHLVKKRYDFIQYGLKKLATYLLDKGITSLTTTDDMLGFINEVGKGVVILLAMYINRWVFSRDINSISIATTIIEHEIIPADILSPLVVWDNVTTMTFKKNLDRTIDMTITARRQWAPPHFSLTGQPDLDIVWEDPLSPHCKISNWIKLSVTNEFLIVVLDEYTQMKTVKFVKNKLHPFLQTTSSGRTAAKGSGSKFSTGQHCDVNDLNRRTIFLEYDEDNPTNSRLSSEGNFRSQFRNGHVIRSVLIPKYYVDGKFHFPSLDMDDGFQVIPRQPIPHEYYLKWAINKINIKLCHPWTLIV